MPNLPNTFGVFLVLEILAAPFGYEGAAALMNRQWVRGAIAYLIALPLGAAGLMTLGVPILGHDLTQAIRIFLTEWLLPLTSNPILVVFLLTLVLTWLGSPRFFSRVNSAGWRVLFGVFFLCFSISMLLSAVRWAKAPSCVVKAGGVAPAPVALVPSDQASAQVYLPNDHGPIANDAVKWRLAQHLHDDFAKIPAQAKSCQMVIVHYQSEYSEDLTQTLSNILKFAGCDVRDFYSETMLPNGITLSLAQNTPEPLKSYIVRIKERLKGDAGIVALDAPNLAPVFHVPAQRPIAANGLYGEIIVGNEPR